MLKKNKMKGLPIAIFLILFIYVLGEPQDEQDWKDLSKRLDEGYNNLVEKNKQAVWEELEKRYQDIRNRIPIIGPREVYDSDVNKFLQEEILKPIVYRRFYREAKDSEESDSSDDNSSDESDSKEERKRRSRNSNKEDSSDSSDSTNESNEERKKSSKDKKKKKTSDESNESRINRSKGSSESRSKSSDSESSDSADKQNGSEKKSDEDVSINSASSSSGESVKKHSDESEESSKRSKSSEKSSSEDENGSSNDSNSSDSSEDEKVNHEIETSYFQNEYSRDESYDEESIVSWRTNRNDLSNGLSNYLNGRGILFPENQSNREDVRTLSLLRPTSLIDILEEIRRRIFGPPTTVRPKPIPDAPPAGLSTDKPVTQNSALNIPVNLPAGLTGIPTEFLGNNIPTNLLRGLQKNKESSGDNNSK